MECKTCGKSINNYKTCCRNKRGQYFCSKTCLEKSYRSKFVCAVCRKTYIEHYLFTCNNKNKCPKCGANVSFSIQYYHSPSDRESSISELMNGKCREFNMSPDELLTMLRKKHGITELKKIVRGRP